MMKPAVTILLRLAPVLALFSCAAPKAVVVELPTVPKKDEPVEPEPTEPAVPALPNDKLRLGDMETLPDDAEFRASNPSLPKPGEHAGAVISRPPTDPPPRPKAKENE